MIDPVRGLQISIRLAAKHEVLGYKKIQNVKIRRIKSQSLNFTLSKQTWEVVL